MQERRKFGPLGWNVRYEFNNSDLSTALKYLKTYLEDFEEIPWPAVNYILGAICYGGRVTDFLDLRCVMCMLKTYLNSDALEQGHSFTPDGVYYPPEPGPLNGVFDYLSTLPMYESPEVCCVLVVVGVTFGVGVGAGVCSWVSRRGSTDARLLLYVFGGASIF